MVYFYIIETSIGSNLKLASLDWDLELAVKCCQAVQLPPL